MNVDGIVVRTFADDGDIWAIEGVRAAVHAHRPTTWMPGPDTDPEPARLPYCLIAEVDGVPVGYTWLTWWVEVDGTRLVLLLGGVAPEFRRRGIGAALLAAQIEAVRVQRPDVPGHGPLILGGNADVDQDDARRLLRRHGFELAFTVVHLESDLVARPPTAQALPPGFAERPLHEADHRLIHAALEECFAVSSHGYVARTYDEYRCDVADRQSDIGLWCVAWAGDEVAGIVINEREDDTEALTTWVAVRAPYRRRGLAAAMLHTGLARCAAAGLRRVVISTILENANHTTDLYESVGYHEFRRQPRYRRPL